MNLPVIDLDVVGAGGGSGTGWDGQVEFRSNLPITLGTPAIGEIYLVEKKTTLLGFTTYQSGLYIRDTNTGALSDWRRLNVKIQFTDSEFTIVSAADTSKRAKFDVSLVTASTTRTYIYPDKNGTIALLSDVTLQGLPSVLGQDNTTGANDISIDDGQVIKATNGSAKLDLRESGTDGNIFLYNDQSYLSATSFGFVLQDGVFFVDPTVPTLTLSNGNQSALAMNKGDFTKAGTIAVKANDSVAATTFNGENYPSFISTQNGRVEIGVVNSGTLFGKDIIVKTDEVAGLNALAYNTGLAGELIVDHTPSATDYAQTHQDDNGIIALTKNIPKAFFAVDLDSAESSISRVVAGGRTTFTVTHNLNTLDLKPEVFRLSDGRTLGWRVERTGVNTVEVSRNGNIADGLFRILI